jgi:ABC-type multidrug transport system ATPase subunit
VIELQGVSKVYHSLFRRLRVQALADLTLSIPRGEVFGIAGPNGAGKSTMLSILLGYLHPSSGSATIDGQRPRYFIERNGVAYLTELVAIPPRWTTESALQRFAAMSDIPRTAARERVEHAIATLGLAEHRRKQIRQLSKGNLQRVGIAQALIAGSDLVIFDEPTHGLDPVWTQRFRDIVNTLRNSSRTIIIASHNLDELERLTDRVAILSQGRLQRIVVAGGVQTGGEYRLVLAHPSPRLLEVFPEAVPLDGRPNEWRVSGDIADLNRRLRLLLSTDVTITAFYPAHSRLESEFHAAVGEPGA